MKRTRCFIVLGVALFCFAVPVSQAGAGQKTFKIGLDLTFSGAAGAWGKIFKNGDQMVADYFNSKGGVKIGGESYQIVFVEGDNGFTAEGGANVGRRLIDADKVRMIHGGIVTQDTLGLQEVSEPAKVISMTTGAADEVIRKDAGKKYSFRAYISYSETYPAMLKWLSRVHPDKKRIALLDLNYDSSWRGHKLINQNAPKFGLEVVYDDYYDKGTKDFYPFLTKALAKKPDVFFNAGSPPPEWALRIKQARELGYKGLFMENHPLELETMAEIAGAENLEGLIGIDYVTEGKLASEATKNFRATYIKKHGHWDPFAIMVAPPLAVILQAFEKAGSLDSDKVVPILESGKETPNFTGITGAFGGMSRYGRNAQWLCPQYIHVAKDGKAVPLMNGKVTIQDMLAGD